MAVVPLDNAAWGFESNCFVCEARNTQGLRIPFVHDEDAGVVRADFRLGSAFSGAPQYVHGGVLLAILDEAMAWAAIALGRRFAVTSETSARFRRPAKVDAEHRVEARLLSRETDAIEAEATVVDAKGRVCAEGRAVLVPLSAAQAQQAIGTEPGEREAGFVEPDR